MTTQEELERSKEELEEFARNQEEEFERLKASARPLHELVVSEKFTVGNVRRESVAKTILPPFETIRMGVRYKGSEAGYTSKLILEVSPDNSTIPVRTLYFDGTSSVQPGHTIVAKIPKYEERGENGRHNPTMSIYENTSEMFYVDRDFKPKENAIELVISFPNGKQSTEISVDYEDFMKKE